MVSKLGAEAFLIPADMVRGLPLLKLRGGAVSCTSIAMRCAIGDIERWGSAGPEATEPCLAILVSGEVLRLISIGIAVVRVEFVIAVDFWRKEDS